MHDKFIQQMDGFHTYPLGVNSSPQDGPLNFESIRFPGRQETHAREEGFATN